MQSIEKFASSIVSEEIRNLMKISNQPLKVVMKVLADQALFNCHAPGLHSMPISRAESGAFIRIFYAEPHHELHFNKPGDMMRIGFHNHDRNLVLVNMFGNAVNINAVPVPKEEAEMEIPEFTFVSKIRTGNATNEMQLTGQSIHVKFEEKRLAEKILFLGPELHTVYVPQGEVAAWLILEGERNGEWNKNMYSTHLNPELEADPMMYMKPSLELFMDRLAKLFEQSSVVV